MDGGASWSQMGSTGAFLAALQVRKHIVCGAFATHFHRTKHGSLSRQARDGRKETQNAATTTVHVRRSGRSWTCCGRRVSCRTTQSTYPSASTYLLRGTPHNIAMSEPFVNLPLYLDLCVTSVYSSEQVHRPRAHRRPAHLRPGANNALLDRFV